MYGKGGWVFVPKHKLPIKKLTAKEKRENASSKRDWNEKRKAILAIAAEANKKARKYGGSIPFEDDYEDGPGFPELKVPHPEGMYDVGHFTAKDRAVYKYDQDSRWENDDKKSLEALRDVVGVGVGVVLAFMGMSGGLCSLAEFKRDGPPVPDFLNDNWSNGYK